MKARLQLDPERRYLQQGHSRHIGEVMLKDAHPTLQAHR